MGQFTQPLCTHCWIVEYDRRTPHRVTGDTFDEALEICCQCGTFTTSGIWCRRDPTTVPYPRRKQDQ